MLFYMLDDLIMKHFCLFLCTIKYDPLSIIEKSKRNSEQSWCSFLRQEWSYMFKACLQHIEKKFLASLLAASDHTQVCLHCPFSIVQLESKIKTKTSQSQTFQKIPRSPPSPPTTTMAAAAAAAAAASRAIFCELSPQRSPARSPKEPQTAITRLRQANPPVEGGKIVLQPRLCTLRSYGDGAIRRVARDGDASSFFGSLADYIESSSKSQDFEIVSGRLAMIAFAAAVGVEFVTGNSLFKKLELQQIAEAAGLCVAVVALAAVFAWFSSAKTRIGQMFTLSCNQFVDSIIDNLVDGLFYDSELSDWPDDM